jgi:hypothetical protein
VICDQQLIIYILRLLQVPTNTSEGIKVPECMVSIPALRYQESCNYYQSIYLAISRTEDQLVILTCCVQISSLISFGVHVKFCFRHILKKIPTMPTLPICKLTDKFCYETTNYLIFGCIHLNLGAGSGEEGCTPFLNHKSAHSLQQWDTMLYKFLCSKRLHSISYFRL